MSETDITVGAREDDVRDYPGGLRGCLEAILMAADQPQTAADLARILATDEKEIVSTLESLRDDYTQRHCGFELRRSARGWQYASRAIYEPVVAAFVSDSQTARLSQAALEALAIIAYRQPVTRARIAAVRGVNSDGVIRSLAVRGLIRQCGVDPQTRAALLATTDLFLDYMGLESLDQLPPLAPFLPQSADAVGTVADGAEG